MVGRNYDHDDDADDVGFGNVYGDAWEFLGKAWNILGLCTGNKYVWLGIIGKYNVEKFGF